MDVTPTTPQPRPTPTRGKAGTAKNPAAPPTLTKLAAKPVRQRKAAAEPTEPLQQSAAPLAADLGQRIALTAYFLAEARNFEPGHELEDWLEAERRESAAQQQ